VKNAAQMVTLFVLSIQSAWLADTSWGAQARCACNAGIGPRRQLANAEAAKQAGDSAIL
jgi:hypothetical protein